MQIQSVTAQRQHFAGLQGKHYFNYGGQGILPTPALDAIVSGFQYLETHGPFSMAGNRWAMDQCGALRQALATEMGTTSDRLTLTENVTMGCNIALWGLTWEPGDEILLSDCEHPGVYAIVQELGDRFGVVSRIFPLQDHLNDGDPTATIAAHLTPRTKLLAISHLLWNTGQVLPLGKIIPLCHHQRVKVLVDAAQSAGSLPLALDQLQPDFYAFTGHKWFCGPAGVGGLYISEQAFKQSRPAFLGWRSLKQDVPPVWTDNGVRFEVATSAYTLYGGLTRSLSLHQEWGTPSDRHRQICQLSGYLWEQLQQIPQIHCLKATAPEAGLVSFTVENQVHRSLVQQLEQEKIMVRTLTKPDCIRACVHYFTSAAEIDHLVAQIKALL